jgi:hypothetical protein
VNTSAVSLPSFFCIACLWTSSVGTSWPRNSVLGRRESSNGIDFLHFFKLMVNPDGNHLVDMVSCQSFHTFSMSTASVSVGYLQAASVQPVLQESTCGQIASQVASCRVSPSVCRFPRPCLFDLLAQYQDVVNPGKSLPPKVHDVVHHIVTSNPPLASRIRRLHGDKLEAARQEFLTMEKEGIIRRSTQPMGLSFTHGAEEGWDLAALWRLPAPQPGDGAGPLFAT